MTLKYEISVRFEPDQTFGEGSITAGAVCIPSHCCSPIPKLICWSRLRNLINWSCLIRELDILPESEFQYGCSQSKHLVPLE